jgi:adhesin transport system outer membrane protein
MIIRTVLALPARPLAIGLAAVLAFGPTIGSAGEAPSKPSRARDAARPVKGPVFGPSDDQAKVPVALGQSPAGLAVLIPLAIETHPSVSAARAGVRAGDSAVSAAQAQYYPTPEANVDLGGDRSYTSVGLSVPVWSGGRLGAGVSYARAERDVALAGVALSRSEIAFRTVEAFQAWAVAVHSVRIKQAELRRLNDRFGLIKRRIAAGASGAADGELVESRVLQAEGELAGYQANERAALAVLAQLLGVSVQSRNLDLAEPVPALPTCGVLVSRAMTDAPAIVRGESLVKVANADSQLKRTRVFPTVSGKLAYNRVRGYGPPQDDVRAFVSVSMAPGAGLGSFAEMDAANAQVDAALESVSAQRRDLAGRIEGQCETLEAARALQQRLVAARASAERVYQSYNRLFIAGKRSWLDVMNAAREVTGVELALAQAEERIRATTWNLILLTGQTTPAGLPA